MWLVRKQRKIKSVACDRVGVMERKKQTYPPLGLRFATVVERLSLGFFVTRKRAFGTSTPQTKSLFFFFIWITQRFPQWPETKRSCLQNMLANDFQTNNSCRPPELTNCYIRVHGAMRLHQPIPRIGFLACCSLAADRPQTALTTRFWASHADDLRQRRRRSASTRTHRFVTNK